MASRFGLAVAAWALGTACAGAEERFDALEARAAGAAAALARPISRCVQRHDTEHPAFHGCIDWHSAVHGTWALIAYAGATGDRRYLPLVEAALTPSAVAAERALLSREPDFEMPYGRAWFLRLAVAHRRLYRSELLAPMAREVAASLIAYLEARTPAPFARAYDSQSWALINLLDYAEAVADLNLAARTTAIARESFVRPEVLRAGCTRDREGAQFMAVCGNLLWLASRLLPTAELKAALAGLPLAELYRPVTEPRTAHENGLNFSRAWGLWQAYAATGDTALAELYAAHVAASLERPATWDGDYREVGHWVSQFGMLAVLPLMERRHTDESGGR